MYESSSAAAMMRPRLKPLRDQVMVITGATSGIGLATAREAARRGASVFLISRNADALARQCAEIMRTSGARAAFAAADVGDEAQVLAAAGRALELFGRIDTWVNVAGVGIYAPLLATPLHEHERLFRTNYWGVVNASRAAIKHLRGGAFITVASVVADFGAPLLGAYAASKHAIKGYIDSLRVELLAERVPTVVTLIKPSGVATPFAEHAATHTPHAAKIPPPAYTPDIVANAILFAAQHPRRELTVGGAGALQIAGAKLLPKLADHICAWFKPYLTDRTRRPSETNNLFSASTGGRERTDREAALTHSIYTTARLTSGWTTGFIVLGLATLGISYIARRGRRPTRVPR
jgi:NAD(P)-dependent dehydrogenase (short-subunit alcohol dehydrogenase family)